MASSGQPVKLSRPLDFLVVADHSDNMGFFPDLFAGKPEVLADPTGRKWYDMIQSGKGAETAIEIIIAFSQGTFPKALMHLPGTSAYRGALSFCRSCALRHRAGEAREAARATMGATRPA